MNFNMYAFFESLGGWYAGFQNINLMPFKLIVFSVIRKLTDRGRE